MTKVKRYVTKYALSHGLLHLEGKMCSDISSAYMFKATHPLGGNVYFHIGEHFETLEEAIADCEHRRNKKIASLNRQIAKLQEMKFEI